VRRPFANPFLWIAWLLVALALLLPVGAMVWRSVRVHEVVFQDGHVHRAVGEVLRTDEGYSYDLQVGDERVPCSPPFADVREVRSRFSLDHYARIFTARRTLGLLEHSAWIGLGGALLALLIGLPVAWVLARTDLRGRGLLGVLCVAPVILPPFFVALGGARKLQALLIACFGVSGGTLQIMNSILVFGLVLYPIYVLLLGPALAAVPAGPWEAARLLGGRRAAFRTVTLPALRPSVVGGFVLVFVIALTDFAVPDVLGFMLPAGGTPTQVFATEILLQWKQNKNAARAVATAAPFLAVTLLLLFVALAFLRHSPVLTGARGHRTRSRLRLGWRGRTAAYLFLACVLGASLVLPLGGIASWAGSGGESSAGGSARPAARASSGAALFDFSGTLDRTTGSRGERDRWLRTGLAAALLAMLVAAPMARLLTRGGRLGRAAVIGVGALPLALPGMVLGAGTLLLWQAVPGTWLRPLEDGIARSALVLAAKFLPFALFASWLGLRGVRRGQEESAAMLGAGGWTRAWRVLTPQAWPGILAGGLLVLVFALRELDSVVLVDVRILPMRLYDKIHFNRMGDEANLLLMCVGYLLVPALAGLVLVRLRRVLPRLLLQVLGVAALLAALGWVILGPRLPWLLAQARALRPH
jgi:iron(III) transport system permease protein